MRIARAYEKFDGIFLNFLRMIIEVLRILGGMSTRSKASVILKLLTAISALGGVLLSLIQATRDGYSHWTRRLLYFTAQSNIWIGVVCLILAFAPLLHFSEVWMKRLYVLKYVFTVSITITGLVFCTLLAPFADESYHLWVLSGYMTHVFSPALAIADYFVDDYPFHPQTKHVYLSILPPLIYFIFTMAFSGLKVDFGHGEFYPYYFLNFRSPAGFFGFSTQAPFFIGSFYWVILFSALVLFIAWGYAKLSPAHKKTKATKR